MAKKNYYAWILKNGECGITKTWEECKNIIDGQSAPIYKGYSTFDEAWNHIFPGKPIPRESDVFDNSGMWKWKAGNESTTVLMPDIILPVQWIEVDCIDYDSDELPFVPSRFYCTADRLEEIKNKSAHPCHDFFKECVGTEPFNNPVDLPECITKCVHDYFGVNNLSEIDPEQIARIKHANMFTEIEETDYSDKAEAYFLLYMPVNFYKVWKPLMELFSQNKLSNQAKILELGPGPGTTTMGTICFYMECAKTYPQRKFSLNITVLERAEAFITIFQSMINGLKKNIPENLQLEVSFVHTDALEGRFWNSEGYDLILESNMLNANEDISKEAFERFKGRVLTNLKVGGKIVLIEPGTKNDYRHLRAVADSMKTIMKCLAVSEPITTDVSAITLKRETEEAGLRTSVINVHWFTYLLMERTEAEE